MSAWTRTADREPPDGTTVLGYWAGYLAPGVFGVVTFAGLWHNPEDDEDDFAPPEYWMLLPKPPEAA